MNNQQRFTLRALWLLSLCLALNACGTKGPLYIPEQQYPPAATSNQ